QGNQEAQKRREYKKKRGCYDDEEKDLLAAYESGEFKPVKDQQTAKQTAVQAAGRYLRKDARVNIRLSSADLEMLKQRAAEEGLRIRALSRASSTNTSAATPAPETRQDDAERNLREISVELVSWFRSS